MVFRGDQIERGAEQLVRKAALAADQVGVLRTPVDTGRARANWFVSTGIPSSETVKGPDTGDKTANAASATSSALAQGQGAVAGYRLRMGPIFITNNVPYIGFLDSGSSDQAPAGITPFMIQAAQRFVRRARLLKG